MQYIFVISVTPIFKIYFFAYEIFNRLHVVIFFIAFRYY